MLRITQIILASRMRYSERTEITGDKIGAILTKNVSAPFRLVTLTWTVFICDKQN